jgi:lysophospholipase L1-like esterase
MLTRRAALVAGSVSFAALAAVPALAETWEEQWQRRLREDWPGWKRYAADNARVVAEGHAVDVVFLGDSITEGWKGKRPDWFSKSRICRGVSGETSPQMLIRMTADVCDLKPRFVHIMAGTNDIAGNTGAMTRKNSQDCFSAMHAIASAHGIGVVFASVPPAANFPWRAGLDTVTPISELNLWLRAFAKRNGATFIDYHSVLADGQAAMKPGMAFDGVHPTAEGYAAMEGLAAPIMNRLLKFRTNRKNAKRIV